MLAGFQQFGLQPGPLLFATNAPLVWGLIASLLVANLMLLVLNLPLIGLWVKLLTVPYRVLFPAIIVFASVGCFAIASLSAVWTAEGIWFSGRPRPSSGVVEITLTSGSSVGWPGGGSAGSSARASDVPNAIAAMRHGRSVIAAV
jgi:hypothetical protein